MSAIFEIRSVVGAMAETAACAIDGAVETAAEVTGAAAACTNEAGADLYTLAILSADVARSSRVLDYSDLRWPSSIGVAPMSERKCRKN